MRPKTCYCQQQSSQYPIFPSQVQDQSFLQETYSSKEYAQIWEAEWGGKAYFSHGSSHSKGFMTLVNPNLDVKVEKCIQDTNGRFLILDLLFDELHLIGLA